MQVVKEALVKPLLDSILSQQHQRSAVGSVAEPLAPVRPLPHFFWMPCLVRAVVCGWVACVLDLTNGLACLSPSPPAACHSGNCLLPVAGQSGFGHFFVSSLPEISGHLAAPPFFVCFNFVFQFVFVLVTELDGRGVACTSCGFSVCDCSSDMALLWQCQIRNKYLPAATQGRQSAGPWL